ncbi:MAG TPA: NAD-dependent epimerase/dehydratase family protein, partial [Caulobacteraceae bacterium]|nr:NAD-dependent epimerase/dehydratase family protein [Caulobacteraceae bacterium]
MAGRIAAVTGATGFLGRRLVPALVERGWQVRALTRSRPPAGLWGEAAVDIVRGDLADADALASLTDGAQAVIHAAGLIKARTRAEFFAANAEGAQRVAQAAGEARMLLISSLAAREPALSDYAASKRAGEEAARMIAGGRLTVVRPPAIYGPGDRETLGLFRLAAQSPVLALPGPATARLALAHVDDVVATILALMEHPAPPASATVPGARPEGYGWREIFQAAAAAVGARPALAAAPRWLVGAAGGVSELAGA